ncbi:hypothetical protein B11Cv2_001700 [Bartonella sp. 1-1C]|nr:hypothetical protein B11Cv2_001700 [Bartonella sp. 1-1C]
MMRLQKIRVEKNQKVDDLENTFDDFENSIGRMALFNIIKMKIARKPIKSLE